MTDHNENPNRRTVLRSIAAGTATLAGLGVASTAAADHIAIGECAREIYESSRWPTVIMTSQRHRRGRHRRHDRIPVPEQLAGSLRPERRQQGRRLDRRFVPRTLLIGSSVTLARAPSPTLRRRGRREHSTPLVRSVRARENPRRCRDRRGRWPGYPSRSLPKRPATTKRFEG
jgi:hypothetical protein